MQPSYLLVLVFCLIKSSPLSEFTSNKNQCAARREIDQISEIQELLCHSEHVNCIFEIIVPKDLFSDQHNVAG